MDTTKRPLHFKKRSPVPKHAGTASCHCTAAASATGWCQQLAHADVKLGGAVAEQALLLRPSQASPAACDASSYSWIPPAAPAYPAPGALCSSVQQLPNTLLHSYGCLLLRPVAECGSAPVPEPTRLTELIQQHGCSPHPSPAAVSPPAAEDCRELHSAGCSMLRVAQHASIAAIEHLPDSNRPVAKSPDQPTHFCQNPSPSSPGHLPTLPSAWIPLPKPPQAQWRIHPTTPRPQHRHAACRRRARESTSAAAQ